MPKILLIDNYDSFVYNVSRYLGQLGCERRVVRNDAISMEEVLGYKPSHIVLSPGPCTPNESGISLIIAEKLYQYIPILGICLGHQVIGQVFGGKVEKALRPMHGRASLITHNAEGLFSGIQNPIKVGRYHSLIVNNQNLSDDIRIMASSQESEIMAISHKYYPLHGVQFHPESVLTEYGYEMLENFIKNA